MLRVGSEINAIHIKPLLSTLIMNLMAPTDNNLILKVDTLIKMEKLSHRWYWKRWPLKVWDFGLNLIRCLLWDWSLSIDLKAFLNSRSRQWIENLKRINDRRETYLWKSDDLVKMSFTFVFSQGVWFRVNFHPKSCQGLLFNSQFTIQCCSIKIPNVQSNLSVMQTWSVVYYHS